MTEKQLEEKKTSEANVSSLSKKIMDRLGWGLLIIGLGITLVILVYALSGSLYDGIGPLKLSLLIIGLLVIICSFVVFFLKPVNWINKHQDILARLVIIKSAIPNNSYRLIKPIRWFAHIAGLFGMALLFFTTIHSESYQGFSFPRIVLMALMGLLAFSGFLFFLPFMERFFLKTSHLFTKSVSFLGQLYCRLQRFFKRVFAWLGLRNDRDSSTELPQYRKTIHFLIKVLCVLGKFIFFLVLILTALLLVFLYFRELYYLTVPEPLLTKRLLRASLLTLIILFVLNFSTIRKWISEYVKKDSFQRFWHQNANYFLIILFLTVIIGGSELLFRLTSSNLLQGQSDVDIWSVINTLPYDWEKLRTEIENNAYQTSNIEGGGPHVTKDYSGEYFNIKDGIRLTYNQPEDPENWIYLVGGDLLYSLVTPDSLTSSSILQELLIDEYGDRYGVVNVSSFFYYAHASLARIKSLEINQDDIVIFFVGTRDADLLTFPDHAYLPHLYEVDPTALTFVESLKEKVQNPGKVTAFRILLHNFLLEHSALYSKFARKDHYYPLYFFSDASIYQMIEYSSEELQLIVLDANEYVSARGGHLLVVLEPNLFVLSEFSERETGIINESYEPYPTLHRTWTIPTAYSYYREDLMAIEVEHEITVYDFSSIFDPENRKNDQEIYSNYEKVLPLGNQILAKNLLNILQKEYLE